MVDNSVKVSRGKVSMRSKYKTWKIRKIVAKRGKKKNEAKDRWQSMLKERQLQHFRFLLSDGRKVRNIKKKKSLLYRTNAKEELLIGNVSLQAGDLKKNQKCQECISSVMNRRMIRRKAIPSSNDCKELNTKQRGLNKENEELMNNQRLHRFEQFSPNGAQKEDDNDTDLKALDFFQTENISDEVKLPSYYEKFFSQSIINRPTIIMMHYESTFSPLNEEGESAESEAGFRLLKREEPRLYLQPKPRTYQSKKMYQPEEEKPILEDISSDTSQTHEEPTNKDSLVEFFSETASAERAEAEMSTLNTEFVEVLETEIKNADLRVASVVEIFKKEVARGVAAVPPRKNLKSVRGHKKDSHSKKHVSRNGGKSGCAKICITIYIYRRKNH